ncbi:MAG: stage 0 sporulation protein [Syntrophobacterales bacterium]|jgi:cell fate regulator YaaT (PSP1 superfamily)|nr:stage 0 sporulation protein [Syntrophobacterales bacterium]
MKSCYIKIDRLTGVIEVQVPDDVKIGDHVKADLEKGHCLALVVTEPVDSSKEGLKKITAKATDTEVAQYFSLKEKENYAFTLCKQKIKDMNLPMKLLWAEYLFGGTKLLFYFVSENRVDFRELVKELAKEFKIRIELRQVGVRDEAKIIGGLGNCGNVCCCRKFLSNFSIVSIKMVKEQGLALNPNKISGICGRLMCCLSYEYEMYVGYKKNFPKLGKRVTVAQGEGKVIKHNTLNSTFTVELDGGKEVILTAKDIIKPDQSAGGDSQRQQPKK